MKCENCGKEHDGSYGSGGGCLFEFYGEGESGGTGGNPYVCIGW